MRRRKEVSAIENTQLKKNAGSLATNSVQAYQSVIVKRVTFLQLSPCLIVVSRNTLISAEPCMLKFAEQ